MGIRRQECGLDICAQTSDDREMRELSTDQAQYIERMLGTGEYRQDPYPIYRHLRRHEPVRFSRAWNAWLITRYTDVEGVLRNSEAFSSSGRLAKLIEPLPREQRKTVQNLIGSFSAGLQHTDPPDHTRIHGLVSRAFTPAFVNNMRQKIQSFVDALLEPVLAQGRMDLVKDFALPLPVLVLGHLLGFSRDECEQFRKWDNDVVALVGSRAGRTDVVERAQRSIDEQVAWLGEVTERRRREPREDLFGALVAGLDSGHIRSLAELHGTYLAILIGGHETTTGLISSAMLLMLRHTDQLRKLRGNLSLMPTAIEECLRCESPLHAVTRVAAAEIQIGTTKIEKGQLIMAMVAAANRDPDVFPNPERFDITRRPNRHLAFGHGVHFCIGAPLARLEGLLALSTLLRRMRNIHLLVEDVEWIENDIFRVPKSLPIEFEAVS